MKPTTKKPKMDLDIDKNMNASLVIECGECRRKSKISLSQASPGKIIKCGCGVEFNLSGDDLRKTQKSLDDLKRSMNNLFK